MLDYMNILRNYTTIKRNLLKAQARLDRLEQILAVYYWRELEKRKEIAIQRQRERAERKEAIRNVQPATGADTGGVQEGNVGGECGAHPKGTPSGETQNGNQIN